MAEPKIPNYTVKDYASFALAGAIGCGVTHGAMTPIDVVKTRIQLEPTVYNKGMFGSFKQVVQSEGAGALLTGLGPTVLGYSMQGAFKFGGYELFKNNLSNTWATTLLRNTRTLSTLVHLLWLNSLLILLCVHWKLPESDWFPNQLLLTV